MTGDVATLTLDQLDAEIAKLRGEDTVEAGGQAWVDLFPSNPTRGEPDGIIGVVTAPPYSRDWALAGPLLEEMHRLDSDRAPCGSVGAFGDGRWSANVDTGASDTLFYALRGSEFQGDTPTEAIARAYLAWKRAQS